MDAHIQMVECVPVTDNEQSRGSSSLVVSMPQAAWRWKSAVEESPGVAREQDPKEVDNGLHLQHDGTGSAVLLGFGAEDGGGSGKHRNQADGALPEGVQANIVEQGQLPDTHARSRKDNAFTLPERHHPAWFECWEAVGRTHGAHAQRVNTVEGLELHENVLTELEEERLVHFLRKLAAQGREGQLCGLTYTAPARWMKGKGRVTMQFGCVYNYATDHRGRAPGILVEERCEPLPLLLQHLLRRLVRWGILPSRVEPDSAIVNLYAEEDCIPPHIDHHDFVRPFCTVSLLSQQPILLGAKVRVAGPGLFTAPFRLLLPRGSVLVMKGASADVAKHCVPAVTAPRISITFRRMADPFRLRSGLPVQNRIGSGSRQNTGKAMLEGVTSVDMGDGSFYIPKAAHV